MKKNLILSLAALTLASVGAKAQGRAMSLKASVSRAIMCTLTRLPISHQSAAIGPSVSLSTLRLSRIG